MTSPRRFRELFTTAMMIVAAWMVFGLFTAVERHRVDLGSMAGQSPEARRQIPALWEILTIYEPPTSLLWAALTPVILYFAERLPLVRPFRWLNVLGVLAVTPLVASLRAVMAGTVRSFIEGSGNSHEILELVRQSLYNRFHSYVLITLAVFGVYNLLIASRAAAASDRQLLEAKKQHANDELQRLRGAIQPRFFFGALREVKAQLRESPVVADRMIVQLGAVLRRMLELERHSDVSLFEELDLVERCLRLEATRTAGRFGWRITADDSLGEARVPPLVLHSIVIPAVMVDGADRGMLQIETWRSGQTLSVSITVDDPARCAGDAALEVTRARLTRLFGERASSVTRTSTTQPTVIVTMPLVTA